MNGVSTNAVMTMTSREMADLTEKRHDNVKRTIETLANQGVISHPQIEEVSNDGPGPKTISLYRIGKRDSYIIVAQLSPEFTARLVDRWQKLEEAAAHPVAALPDFTDPVAAARAWADAVEQRQALAVQAQRQQELLEQAQPKVRALDRISEADGAVSVTAAAKNLQMAPGELFTWLENHKWSYRRTGASPWLAHQEAIERGYLMHKVVTYPGTDGRDRVKTQMLVTPKGLARLAYRIEREGCAV